MNVCINVNVFVLSDSTEQLRFSSEQQWGAEAGRLLLRETEDPQTEARPGKHRQSEFVSALIPVLNWLRIHHERLRRYVSSGFNSVLGGWSNYYNSFWNILMVPLLKDIKI